MNREELELFAEAIRREERMEERRRAIKHRLEKTRGALQLAHKRVEKLTEDLAVQVAQNIQDNAEYASALAASERVVSDLAERLDIASEEENMALRAQLAVAEKVKISPCCAESIAVHFEPFIYEIGTCGTCGKRWRWDGNGSWVEVPNE